MNAAGGRAWVLGSWLTVLALVTVREVSTQKGLPRPGSFLGASVLMTLLFGLAGLAPSLAAALAAGTVVGVAAAPYIAGKTTGPLDQAASWLASISGGQPQGQPAK